MNIPPRRPVALGLLLTTSFFMVPTLARADFSPETKFWTVPQFNEKEFEGTITSVEAKATTVQLADGPKLYLNANTALLTESGGWREFPALQVGQKIRAIGQVWGNGNQQNLNVRVLLLPDGAPVTPPIIVTSGSWDETENKLPPIQSRKVGDLTFEVMQAGFYPIFIPNAKNPINQARRFTVKSRWKAPRPYKFNEAGYRLNTQGLVGAPVSPETGDAGESISPYWSRASLLWNLKNPAAPEGSDGNFTSLLEWKDLPFEPGKALQIDRPLKTTGGSTLTLKTMTFTPANGGAANGTPANGAPANDPATAGSGGTFALEFEKDSDFNSTSMQYMMNAVLRDEAGHLIGMQGSNGGTSGKTRRQSFTVKEMPKTSKLTLQLLFREFSPTKVEAKSSMPLWFHFSPSSMWKSDPRPEVTQPLPKTTSGAYGDYEQERPLATAIGQNVMARLEANTQTPFLDWNPRLWLEPRQPKPNADDALVWTASEMRVRIDGEVLPVRLDYQGNSDHYFHADGTLAPRNAFDDVASLKLPKPLEAIGQVEVEVDAVPTLRGRHLGLLKDIPLPKVGESAFIVKMVAEGDDDQFFQPLSVSHLASPADAPAMPDWVKQRYNGPLLAVVFSVQPISADPKPRIETRFAADATGHQLEAPLGGACVAGDVTQDANLNRTYTAFVVPPREGDAFDLWLGATELQTIGQGETLRFPAFSPKGAPAGG